MKNFLEVNGKNLAYIDEGEGDAIVFIHGNPTSSYLWRNIAPNFNSSHRVIVPDLMGMGDSDKLDGIDNPGYSFNGQYDYLEKFLDQLNLGQQIHLVIHDWGCGLGLKYARLHSDSILSISFMEGVTVPLTWDQWPDTGTKIFKLFQFTNFMEQNTIIFLSFIFIMTLGVSHGALDGKIIWEQGSNFRNRVKIYISYLLIVSAGGLLWMIAPFAGLTLLLILSIFHFGSSDLKFLGTVSQIQKTSWGFLMTFLPLGFHQERVNEIFYLLCFAYYYL